MSLTYSSYLKLDALLSLQEPLSGERARDEMLFIIVHQAYELWFKEILHEIDTLRDILETGKPLPGAQAVLNRIAAIARVMLTHLEVLETMTPLQFLAFRDLLGTASGFQSAQFREVEFALGWKRPEILRAVSHSPESARRLEERYRKPSLWDAFLKLLARRGYSVPPEVLDRDVTLPTDSNPRVRKALIDVYAGAPDIAYLCEQLLDIDERFQEWRYRHVKMVERMIGAKYGTGGSAGVEYLRTTLFKPFFPDLWAIRTEFEKQ